MTPLPRAAPAVFALAVAGITGCGTLAPDGGPVGQLPSSGAGPYRALDQPSPLLADPAASLDDAVVLVDGEAITIYCTRRDDAGHSTIVRARFTSIDDEAPVIDTALVADRDYEGGSVSQPAVLDLGQGGTLLVYTTGEGTLGYAISSGDGFRKGERPAKRQRPELAEPLSSPALLALDDSQVRLLYLDGDFLYSTDATISSLLPLSGQPFANPGLIFPPVAAPPSRLGRVTARTVTTAPGRRRFDLFFSVRASPRWAGFAGSFDGGYFVPAAAPLLEAKAPEEWAPSGAAWHGGTLLVYSRALGRRTVLAAAANQ